MTERSLQASIIEICRLYGIGWYHTADSRRSRKGWPDLTLFARGIIFRELKTERGKLTVEQAEMGDRLRRAGGDWDVWRPSDLSSGRIQRELLAIRVQVRAGV